MKNLVTIRSFSSSVDFEMAKSFLESYGILCIGQDEIINRIYIGNVDGGVKLQVKTEDSSEAIRLLIEAGYLKNTDFELSPAIKWIDKFLSKFRKNNN